MEPEQETAAQQAGDRNEQNKSSPNPRSGAARTPGQGHGSVVAQRLRSFLVDGKNAFFFPFHSVLIEK